MEDNKFIGLDGTDDQYFCCEALFKLVPLGCFYLSQAENNAKEGFNYDWVKWEAFEPGEEFTGVRPTIEEIRALARELHYEQWLKRGVHRRKYPKFGEQLDTLYWDMVNGTTVWQDEITAIKEADLPDSDPIE